MPSELGREPVHASPLEVAEVGVHVPVTMLDGDDLHTDVALDDVRRGVQRLAKVRPGRRPWAGRVGVSRTGDLHVIDVPG